MDEIRAETIIGFFVTEKLAASSCDRLLGEGPVMAGLYGQMAIAHHDRLAKADQVREGYFKRAYGDRWKTAMDHFDRLFLQQLAASLVFTKPGCEGLHAEMERRVAGGWPYIDRQIEAQVQLGVRMEATLKCGEL
jgi:cytochrome c1